MPLTRNAHTEITGPHLRVGVAVVAAGESRRMGGLDKVLLPLGDRPLIAHCLGTFVGSPLVDSVCVATSAQNVRAVEDIVATYEFAKVESVVEGGQRRQDSVLNAVKTLGDVDIVLVHDGARPFVDHPMIERAVDAAHEFKAATAAVPVKDTIKVVDADSTITDTPPRDSLWAAQTPQAFERLLLLRAHAEIDVDSTDDSVMVEALGQPVKVFMGSYDNIKVTTPEDVQIAETIAKSRIEVSLS